MDIPRIRVLMGQEIRLGAANFMSLYVLVMPVVLSLLIALVFGDLLARTPRLGVYDAGGNEALVRILRDHPSVKIRVYRSEAAMERDVGRGTVEMGLGLAAGFADALAHGDTAARLTVYRWGETGARNLLLLESVVARTVVEGSGYAFDQLPVRVHVTQLGRADTVSWSQRLLPLLLILALVLSGLFIPAASLVEEKQRGTLVALTTTPASLLDVYLAKTFVGVCLSGAMAAIILLLNGAWTGQPGLLCLAIVLGGLMSSVLGMLLGSVSRDMETFMGIVKVLGLILYAPGILEIFPQAPPWLGRLFPTYYIMQPILEITQNAARFADVALDLAILAAFIAGLLFALTRVIRQQQAQLALPG